MNKIVYNSIRDLNGLISNTYILAIVIAVVFVGISIAVSSMIAFEGGRNPRDPKKRRVWFIILGIIGTILFFSWNYFIVLEKIKPVASFQNQFLKHAGIATGVTLVVYVLVGFILSKLMRRKKYGTIFSSAK